MLSLRGIEARGERIEMRASKSDPRTPIGLAERKIGLISLEIKNLRRVQRDNMASLHATESKIGTDLLNWKSNRTSDLHTWLLRGDSLKIRMDRVWSEKRNLVSGFEAELRVWRERLLVALTDLDQLRE